MTKKLSVIIVTYNSKQHIFDCLDSIIKYNDIEDSLEIIVVDNCSNDQQEMFDVIVSKYSFPIKLITSTHNGGYGSGNNQGVAISEAPYFVVINPDVRLIQPIFKRALSVFSSSNNIGLIGLKQLDEHHNSEISFFYRREYQTFINTTILLKVLNKLNLYIEKKMFPSGALFFFDKKAFQDAGCFDENIFMYGEENDILNRLNAIGKKAQYVSQLKYVHLMGDRTLPSTEVFLRQINSYMYYCDKYNLPRRKVLKRILLKLQYKKIYYILCNNNLMKKKIQNQVNLLLEKMTTN